MAGLQEETRWENEIYRIEENDPVHGGEDGITNKPIKQLANRTKYLKKEIEKRYIAQDASTEQKGLVQLDSSTDSNAEDKAATPRAINAVKVLVTAVRSALSNYIPNSKKSNDDNSTSSDTVATSYAVKKVRDIATKKATDTVAGQTVLSHKTDGTDKSKAASEFALGELNKELAGKGVPIGSVVAFPKGITPQGYLLGNGGPFSRQTYPDLYQALGVEILPNLNRSDVGMTAYFATDSIPEGWIAFDSIRSTVTQQNYPELYQYLVDKYSSISNVPLVEDRFIRNTGNGLNVGQTQSDEIKKHVHKVRTHWIDSSDSDVFYDKTKTVVDSRLITTTITDNNLSDNGFMHPLLDSPMATGGYETRPKAIVLKLCIKAKNTFDDVQFWIKAFGVVENVGALDAGTLAQNMQALSASVEQKIEENKQSTLREINNAKADINQQFLQAQENLSQIGTLKTVWQGNVGSGRINISEKCFGKTLILYLQSSVSHRLDDNYNIEPVSFEVGAEIEGKRGGVYWLDVRRATYNIGNYTAGERFAVTVDRNGTTIQIQHLAGRFVKRIDIR
ncbi:TPA: phage tail protein [Pasteurella multocida]|uniref:phage tail protein n=1 Tax=Pasteurella multocida TaxID=747 RepID=UPI0028E09F02|nr:tail fiber protein [Pasteurella multocida]HDR1154225.1 tail fiber protein [Pasteurella multocida]HDR1165378.1 tail fiber protein [Pasteurella multocida]HDR1508833.1 tail fiber protein [Pasteurella multocida]HEA3315758.1 tail fiber protein [Pasteurella multocida]